MNRVEASLKSCASFDATRGNAVGSLASRSFDPRGPNLRPSGARDTSLHLGNRFGNLDGEIVGPSGNQRDILHDGVRHQLLLADKDAIDFGNVVCLCVVERRQAELHVSVDCVSFLREK